MMPHLFSQPLRCLAAPLVLAMACTAALAQDSTRSDWLANPAMGNYKAYAEFKMAHYAAARQVWETLATVGNGDALFNLAILAEDGLGEARNMDKAEKLYTAAAASGNFKAQYRLGMLYSAGGLLTKDAEKARLYLSQAAASGDKDAQARLLTLDHPPASMSAFAQAELHSASGRHEQAARLYEQLAAAGDHKSQTRLAWMHEAGRGVVRDLAEAARRFQLAADGGDAQAQYALAVMYRTGQGKVQDAQASAHWLRRAAAQQYPPAVSALQSLDEQTAPR